MPKRRFPRSPPPQPPTNIHYPTPRVAKVTSEGELHVTGDGQIVIDEPLKRTRALLIRSVDAIIVEFGTNDPPCPPCAGEAPDEVRWEVIERRRELFLKITWHVNSARTIIWKIFEVD